MNRREMSFFIRGISIILYAVFNETANFHFPFKDSKFISLNCFPFNITKFSDCIVKRMCEIYCNVSE